MTKHEIEILNIMRSRGKTATDIALALQVSVNTVRSYIRRHPPEDADRMPPVRETDTPSEGQKGQILLFRPMPKCMVERPSGTGAAESLLPSDL